jgi:hypothetical protein
MNGVVEQPSHNPVESRIKDITMLRISAGDLTRKFTTTFNQPLLATLARSFPLAE